jgi:hypothetical protein
VLLLPPLCQLLINALIGKVKSEQSNLYGKATYQESAAAADADKVLVVARSGGPMNGSSVLEPSDVKGGPACKGSAETIHREANQE